MPDEYVRVSRGLLTDQRFADVAETYAALWLMLHASTESETVKVAGKSVSLEPGQLACVPAALAAAWKLSEPSAVRRVLQFVAMGFIKLSQQGEVGVITICKYAEYPNIVNTEKAHDLFGEYDVPQVPDESPTIEELFNVWYKHYPHKVGRGQAFKAFPKALKKAGNLGVLIAGVSRYVKSKPPDRSFANPATWLNGERWLDQEAPPNPSAALIRRNRYAI